MFKCGCDCLVGDGVEVKAVRVVASLYWFVIIIIKHDSSQRIYTYMLYLSSCLSGSQSLDDVQRADSAAQIHSFLWTASSGNRGPNLVIGNGDGVQFCVVFWTYVVVCCVEYDDVTACSHIFMLFLRYKDSFCNTFHLYFSVFCLIYLYLCLFV